ncbi:MAG: phosphatase PAP2 family protein [bacterium]
MHFIRSLPRQTIIAVITLTLALLFTRHADSAQFIDPASYNITAIIPAPPQPGSEQYKMDTGYLKNARSTSTRGQIDRAMTASHDSVFDYSDTLGSWFNSRDLPKTAKLFDQVYDQTKEAIQIAKHHFGRERPIYWHLTGDKENSNGYSYPSGHTTRAFVWAIMLSNAFPDMAKELHSQARQKAWYRVILGRHFPADVRAGKIYGKFLAGEFLKNPAFQKEWAIACKEMRDARKKATTH